MCRVSLSADSRPHEAIAFQVLATWFKRLKGLLGTSDDADPVALVRLRSAWYGRAAREQRGYENATVHAVPMTELEENLKGVSAIILGPQMRFAEKDVRAIAGTIPLMAAAPQDFGLMRANVIMDQVEALLAG